MLHLIRTDAENEDFLQLMSLLDAELAIRDGDDHSFYAQYNKVDSIKHAIIVYAEEKPVGIGAIKRYDPETVEIKRMYTVLESRGRGLASMILKELEKWASELSYQRCILETGINQHEAISLYFKNEYQIIENYGQYAGVVNSKCFEKKLAELQ